MPDYLDAAQCINSTMLFLFALFVSLAFFCLPSGIHHIDMFSVCLYLKAQPSCGTVPRDVPWVKAHIITQSAPTQSHNVATSRKWQHQSFTPCWAQPIRVFPYGAVFQKLLVAVFHHGRDCCIGKFTFIYCHYPSSNTLQFGKKRVV